MVIPMISQWKPTKKRQTSLAFQDPLQVMAWRPKSRTKKSPKGSQLRGWAKHQPDMGVMRGLAALNNYHLGMVNIDPIKIY